MMVRLADGGGVGGERVAASGTNLAPSLSKQPGTPFEDQPNNESAASRYAKSPYCCRAQYLRAFYDLHYESSKSPLAVELSKVTPNENRHFHMSLCLGWR